jgi:hypothetical protein
VSIILVNIGHNSKKTNNRNSEFPNFCERKKFMTEINTNKPADMAGLNTLKCPVCGTHHTSTDSGVNYNSPNDLQICSEKCFFELQEKEYEKRCNQGPY